MGRVGNSFEWARSAGGPAWDRANAIAIDSAGNATVVGGFWDTVRIGPYVLAAKGSVDAYVARFKPDGSIDWARSGGNATWDEANALALDGAGRATIVGGFGESGASFGPHLLAGAGYKEIFVARLAADGTFASAESAGGTGFDEAYAVAVDRDGRATIAGSFMKTATFGAHTLTATGKSDAFIWRLPAP